MDGKYPTKMKGNLTRRLLEAIENRDITATDLLGAFLSAGYGASRSRIEYIARQNNRTRKRDMAMYAQKQKYYNLISRLQRDGLIEKSEVRGTKTVSITTKGRGLLSESRNRANQRFSATNLAMEKSEHPIIIIFDIPERKRRSRKFLREALKTIGFRILQKSVWIGEIKIPKELIVYLRSMSIIDYIHIFEVNSLGSL